jgi:hypothetical protein
MPDTTVRAELTGHKPARWVDQTPAELPLMFAKSRSGKV